MKSDGMSHWPEILPPMVAAPLANAPVNSVTGFVITLNPIVLAAGLLQTSTDYEIRTAPNGGGVATWSSLADATALLAKTVPIGATSTLAAGQTYYIRARFRAGATVSGWSSDVRVTT